MNGEVQRDDMSTITRIEVPPRLTVLLTLAQLLERLEHSSKPIHAEQYRSVVQHLVKELGSVEHDDTFRQLLNAFPAMSQLHENMNYDKAGLCRSPLSASLEAEAEARAALARAVT
jgi:hypothetical protein